jgi:hypothetical protein
LASLVRYLTGLLRGGDGNKGVFINTLRTHRFQARELAPRLTNRSERPRLSLDRQGLLHPCRAEILDGMRCTKSDTLIQVPSLVGPVGPWRHYLVLRVITSLASTGRGRPRVKGCPWGLSAGLNRRACEAFRPARAIAAQCSAASASPRRFEFCMLALRIRELLPHTVPRIASRKGTPGTTPSFLGRAICG